MLSIHFLFLFSVFTFIFLAEEPRRKKESLITKSEQMSFEKDKSATLMPGSLKSSDIDQTGTSVCNSLETDYVSEKKIEEQNQLQYHADRRPHCSREEEEFRIPLKDSFKRKKLSKHASLEFEYEKDSSYFYPQSGLESSCINLSAKRQKSVSFTEEIQNDNKSEGNESIEELSSTKNPEVPLCQQLISKVSKPEMTTPDT